MFFSFIFVLLFIKLCNVFELSTLLSDVKYYQFNFKFYFYAVNLFFMVSFKYLFSNYIQKSNPLFLKLFVLKPTNKINFSFKHNFILVYLNISKYFTLVNTIISTLCFNIFHTRRWINIKTYLWRPLIKRWSYFGLYVHSRALFLKNFKTNNDK
jgi:hypothetical protein